MFLQVFEGVPPCNISLAELTDGVNVVELLSDKTQIFSSRGEARKMIQGGGVSVNKEKVVDANASINSSSLISSKYLLVQKGKKNYYLVKAV